MKKLHSLATSTSSNSTLKSSFDSNTNATISQKNVNEIKSAGKTHNHYNAIYMNNYKPLNCWITSNNCNFVHAKPPHITYKKPCIRYQV